MKKVLLAAMAVCAVFASCSNDGDSNNEGKAKSLRVQFPESVTGVRGVETPVTVPATTTINNATVFFLSGSAVVEYHTLTSTEVTSGKDFQDVVASVNNVLVVGNIPSTDLATVQALTSESAIRNYAYTVDSQSTGAGVTDKLHMGSAAVPATPELVNPIAGSSNEYFLVTVNLDAITARFEIGGITEGVGIVAGSLKLHGVWINKYPATRADAQASSVVLNETPSDPLGVTVPITSMWYITPVADKALAAAVVSPVTVGNPSYTNVNYYTAGNVSVTNANPPAAVYAYTLFSGAYVPQLIMLVSGQYETGYHTNSADEYFLGWVTFTKFLDTDATPNANITKVEPNKIYKAFGGITVDYNNITITPNLNIDLGIRVTVSDWTAVNVTPGV